MYSDNPECRVQKQKFCQTEYYYQYIKHLEADGIKQLKTVVKHMRERSGQNLDSDLHYDQLAFLSGIRDVVSFFFNFHIYFTCSIIRSQMVKGFHI